MLVSRLQPRLTSAAGRSPFLVNCRVPDMFTNVRSLNWEVEHQHPWQRNAQRHKCLLPF